MAMTPLVLHILLIVALAALGGTGLRLASRMAPSGLERLLTWAVLLASAVVLQALALGLVGLGGTPVALAGAAVLTWLAAHRWIPRPEVPVSRELVAWWRGLGPVRRAAIGALAGAVVAVIAISLRRPGPGFDGITYHLPEIVGFVQGGHPGAVLHLNYGLPVGNFPLTNEVLLAWVAGISHGFAPLVLWSPVSAGLLIAAGWLGLRGLRVPTLVRVVALAALVLGPLLIDALGAPGTDLPALAWLACSAALCLAASNRPVLLAPAILAFGLAVGTKTTPAPLGLIVIGIALWRCRARLAAIAWPLSAAVLAAGAAGGTWYLRNLVVHGSPLWPFVAASWGDPVPQSVQLVSHTMLERLRVTLLDHLGAYVTGVSGSTVLLVAGVLVPLLTLRRRPLLAAGAVALGALAWASAPLTGRPDLAVLFPAVATSVRYLLPVFAAGALALALAASDGPRRPRILALGVLIAAAVWGLIDDLKHHFGLPFSSWIIVGVLAGALLGALGAPRPWPPWRWSSSLGSRLAGCGAGRRLWACAGGRLRRIHGSARARGLRVGCGRGEVSCEPAGIWSREDAGRHRAGGPRSADRRPDAASARGDRRARVLPAGPRPHSRRVGGGQGRRAATRARPPRSALPRGGNRAGMSGGSDPALRRRHLPGLRSSVNRGTVVPS